MAIMAFCSEGPRKRRQRDGQDQERDRQHGVGDAADDGVDPAPP
jgi:hypothetical protein